MSDAQPPTEPTAEPCCKGQTAAHRCAGILCGGALIPHPLTWCDRCDPYHDNEPTAERAGDADDGCTCVGYTIRTDYGTGIEHDVDRSDCLIHGAGDADDAATVREAVLGELVHDRGSEPNAGWFVVGADGYFDVDNAVWCDPQDDDAPWTSEHFDLFGTLRALAARPAAVPDRDENLRAAIEALADEWERSADFARPRTLAGQLRAVLGDASGALAEHDAKVLRDAADDMGEGDGISRFIGMDDQAAAVRAEKRAQQWLRERADRLAADTGATTTDRT